MTRASIAGRGFGMFVWLVFLAGVVRIGAGVMIPIKGVVAQALLERAFDRSLASHRATKPWPWADMTPAARLRVPRLGVERVILDSGSGQAMAFGPALLPGAGRLDGAGAAVIAAHRDTHFRFLGRVRPGDPIELLTVGGRLRRYRVSGSEIVRWDRFALSPARRGLVLVTCYPFDAVRHGPLRYVLYAEPSDAIRF